MKKSPRLKVAVQWQQVSGEPSPLWRRLWAKLLADKKTSPTGVREADSSECVDDGNEQNPANERFMPKESHGQSETDG